MGIWRWASFKSIEDAHDGMGRYRITIRKVSIRNFCGRMNLLRGFKLRIGLHFPVPFFGVRKKVDMKPGLVLDCRIGKIAFFCRRSSISDSKVSRLTGSVGIGVGLNPVPDGGELVNSNLYPSVRVESTHPSEVMSSQNLMYSCRWPPTGSELGP